MARPLLSHIDLRVRDRERARAFYDAILKPLGFARRESEEWTSYYDESAASSPLDYEWFGFTEDRGAVANATRVGFVAATNEEVDGVAATLARLGSSNVEGPNFDEGPGYYAVFFEDPDGNLLEVCCRVS